MLVSPGGDDSQQQEQQQPQQQLTGTTTSSGQENGAAQDRPTVPGVLKEIAEIAAPNILGYVMTLINELTNTICIGHTGGDKELAAVGLANMMQNCFGLSVGFGVCSALDTLVSQAYGAQQHELSVQHLQRCRLIVTLQLVWMAPLLIFSEKWLDLIHQDHQVAHDAGRYNRASVIGLFAVFQFEAAHKFLVNRGDAMPPAVISAVTAVFHVGWCTFFVVYLRLGNAGAGYANAITWWTQLLLMSAYLCYAAPKVGLSRVSLLFIEGRKAFEQWGKYIAVAAPATIQMCAEWWFWELTAIEVGYLGSVALAAHTSALNWVAISFMPVIGLNTSAATLVGNALGANLPRTARRTAQLCVCVNASIWAVLAIAMVLARHFIADVYSSDHDVQRLLSQLLCVFSVVGFCDSSQNVMGGVLRGIGKNDLAAGTYVVSFYFIMFPVGLAFAFLFKWGVHGIWYSFGVGTSIACVVFGSAIMRMNYAKEAAEASARAEQEGALLKAEQPESDIGGTSSSTSAQVTAA